MARWSREEDDAVVALYKRVLAAERKRGAPLNVNEEIRRTAGFTKDVGTIRERMQNVSAVLEELNEPRISNVSPRANYAPQTKEAVLASSLPW